MMPATLTRSHPAPLPSAQSFSVSELSSGERAVALYASDMPSKYRTRRGDGAVIQDWILQGVARLGLEEVHRSAAYAYGYRLLRLNDLDTPEQRRANLRRFPDQRRMNRAEEVATFFQCGTSVGMSEAARARGPQVEGECLCGGTGWIALCDEDGDLLAGVDLACPVHNMLRPGWGAQ
jgi:hypothetical protein